jgi:ribosomal protein RSM22 (predicted rRNA methylase)
MDLTLSSLLPHLIYHFKSENELLKAVEEISLKFTKDRENISDYLKSPRLVAAYTAFYLLTNLPKLNEVFKWMPRNWVELLKDCAFIDLGAGPGTFSLAWKSYGGRGDFYQLELSTLMKEQGKKIWDAIYSEALFQGSRFDWKIDKPKFLLFGHSANEMGVEAAIRYIEIIRPDHILFIEPGTKDFFLKMLDLRSYLINEKYNLLYPCPNELECPLKSTEDWCHQFVHVKQDIEIERISQMLKKDRKLLPLTVQAFSKTFKTNNPHERLVRVLPETKFCHEWEVCHDNKLEHYQLMKRDLTKQDSKALSAVLSGEGLVTEVIKIVDRTKRVKLQKIIKYD